MAKGGNHFKYTEDYFLANGYTKNPDGSYQPPKFKNPFKQPPEFNLSDFKLEPKGEITITPLTDTTFINTISESVLSIPGLVAGLNG